MNDDTQRHVINNYTFLFDRTNPDSLTMLSPIEDIVQRMCSTAHYKIIWISQKPDHQELNDMQHLLKLEIVVVNTVEEA